jgi:hypothetical protein
LGSTQHWFRAALVEAGWAPGVVFVLHVVASRVLGLYLRYPHVDVAIHFSGGFAIAFFFWRAGILASHADVIGRLNRTGLGVLVFGLTCAAAVFWEFAEFLSDRYCGTTAQLGLTDTLKDMLVGIVGGSTFVVACGRMSPRRET